MLLHLAESTGQLEFYIESSTYYVLGPCISYMTCWYCHIWSIVLRYGGKPIKLHYIQLLYCKSMQPVSLIKLIIINKLITFLSAPKFWILWLGWLYCIKKKKNNIVPDCVQKIYEIKRTKYEIRGAFMFTKAKAHDTKLWNLLFQGVN